MDYQFTYINNSYRHYSSYWAGISTSPGGNTQQSLNCMATYFSSWKLSKLDEPDMQDIAGEAGMSS